MKNLILSLCFGIITLVSFSQSAVHLGVQFANSTGLLTLSSVNACEQSTVHLKLTFSQTYSGPLYLGIKGGNPGEYLSGSFDTIIGSRNLFFLGTGFSTADSVVRNYTIHINCDALPIQITQYIDSLQLYSAPDTSAIVPYSIATVQVTDAQGNVSNEIVYQVHRISFATLPSNFNVNYIDVFNATHGGSPVVRQIDYTNIEGNSTDSVYLSFTDTILCRNILFQSVEIKDTNNNVLTSLTGINAHQFRLPVVVANVPTGMILHVRETLSFPNFDSTCVATCPIDSNTFSSHLLYGCYDFSHSGTAENLCMKRKSEGLITLGDKIPRILISRSEPAPNVPGTGSYWDTTFTANPLTHWKFIIWNDSNNVVKDFSILLGHQAYDSTYRYFIPDSSHITVTMHTVHGIPQGDSAYLFRDIYHAPNLPNCIVNNYPNALGAYQKRFDVLYPHDTVEVDFDLVYCCAEPDDGRNTYSLFDTPKSFNTWYLQANGFDECGDEVHGESYLDMANGLYGIEPLFFISQTGEPMYLVQDFSPVNLNFNTDPNTGCSAPIQFHISNQDFGKDHNQIDYSRAAANFFSTDYDLTDGNLMQVHGKVIFQFDLQPGITLEHSLANDIVLSNSIGSWTIESFQSNGATCAAGGSYRVVFNIDSVPGGTTLNNFYDFMNSSTLYFRITGCCCNNSNTNPFFSIKTYMSGLDANCEIPMAKREATASIHCHGCTLPGGVVNASSEPLTRKSFGFVDFDNDGLMDLPQTRVDSSYIAGHPDIALNSSIVGDTLYSVINGSVEDKGSINLATLRGTYGLNLRHLYIEQKIPHSNSSEFDVRMDKLNITMRIGASIYTANLLPSDAMFAVIVHDVRDSTLLAIHPHSDIYFYDLSETVIRSLFSLPSYVLDSATHFSLRPQFHVCRNYQIGTSVAPSDNTWSGTVELNMYLTGADYALGHRYNAYTDHLDSLGVEVLASSGVGRLNDSLLYFCEAQSINHYFYSVYPKVGVTIFPLGGSQCNKSLSIDHEIMIGGHSSNLFPFEFRPVPNIDTISVQFPGGNGNYLISALDTNNSYSVVKTWYSNGCAVPNVHKAICDGQITIPLSGNLTMTHVLADTTVGALYGANCNSSFYGSDSKLFASDEYLHQVLVFPFAWRICGVDSAIHVDSSFVTTSLSLNNCSNQNRIPMEVALLDNSIISENPSHFWAQSITTSPADTPNFCFNFQINDLVYNDGVIKNLFVYLPKLPFFSTMIIDGDTMSVNTLPSGAQIFMYHAGDFGPNFTHNFTICGTLATCLTHDTTFQINYGWNCGGYPDSSQVQNHQICAEFTRNVLLQFDSTVTDFSFSNNIHYQTCRTDSVEDTLRCSSGSIRNIQLIATINDPYLSNVQYRFTYVQNGSNGVSILPDSAVVTGTNTTTFYFNTPQGSYPGYLMSGNRIIMTISFTPLQPWTAPPITVNYHYKTYCGDNEAPHSPTTLSAFQPDVGGCNSLMANANTNASLSCSYSSVVLSGSAQNGVPPLSYHWSSTPSGYSSNLASDTIHPTQTAYYILTVTDSTGATSRDSVLVNVIQSALCCIPSNFQSPPDYNLSNINAKSLGFVSLYGGAAKVLINGTFTVDTNFSFLACHNIIMGPGAVIDVLPGKTLTLNDSHIYSCTEMSQGIQAQAGSTVNLIISTIEDAQYGVLMRESSTLFSDRTNFLNDFVGIKIKPTPGIFSFNLINVYTTFRNTTFDCNRNLVAPYSGQLPISKNHSYAGIDADSVLFLNVVSVSGDLHFRNLNYGVHAYRSNLNVEKVKFEQIQNYDSYGAPKGESGVAVYLNGYGSSMFLNQEGKNDPATPDFVNCSIGVLGKGVNMESFNNNAVNCDEGVVSLLGTGKEIKIHDNKLDCNKVGIFLSLNDGSSMTQVNLNYIQIGGRILDLKGKPSNGYGIIAHEMNNFNSDVKITDNDITLHQFAKGGIRVNGVENYQVLRNIIHLENTVNTSLAGISLWRSNSNDISCNNVYGNRIWQDSTLTDLGIMVQDSKSNTIGCNSLTHTAKGFIFKGSCSSSSATTNLRANDIGHHAIGLYYTASADVDPQVNEGNLWMLNSYQAGAYNLNVPGANFEKYFYDQSGDPRNHPAIVIPSNWFQFNGNTDDNCGNPHRVECETSQNIKTYFSNAGFDKLIQTAKDSILTSEYDEKARWEAKVGLYELLLNFPIYLDSSTILSDFFVNMAGTSIQELASLHIEQDSLLVNSSNLASVVQSNSLDVYTKTMLIKLLDAKLSDNNWKQSEIDSMQNMKEALISIIQSLISFNQIAIQSIKNTTSNHVDLLSNINTSINAQEIYETNEVQVNDIYYGTAAIGNGDDVAGYEATLLSIAQLCPLSDGPAVYHARALYSLIDPDQDYDDDISCVQNGYYFRMQQGVKHKSSVFPNPTSGDVTIVYKFQSDTYLQLEDMYGRTCLMTKLKANSDSHLLNLSNFENGIYTYRLFCQGSTLDIGKIILSK